MGKHSSRAACATILTVLLGIGCGEERSAFSPSDPSQTARGIALAPPEDEAPARPSRATTSAAEIQSCSRTAAVDAAELDELIAGWPAQPKAAVKEMAAKYGMPLEATTESVVWHDAGPYKRITVTKREVPHAFPKPHMDFIEHTIVLDVPTQKVDDLVAFDTSVTVNKTARELSASSDREALNARTLDLAREIIPGRKSVAEARKALGEAGAKGAKGVK
jgi:hypothetical protein